MTSTFATQTAAEQRAAFRARMRIALAAERAAARRARLLLTMPIANAS